MAFFRNVFLLLLIVNASFLGYDYYKGGNIAQNLVENAKQLDVPTVQAHLHNAWAQVKTVTPEKLAGHVNNAFEQLKDFNSPADVVNYLRDKASGVIRGSGTDLVTMDGNVVVLTGSNFHKVIDGSKPALVEFYAPWCGHCKRLAPTYEELGEAFAQSRDEVIIAKVDADAHRDLGGEFGIQGFPTIKWFPKGVTTADGVEDYRGGRDLDSLTKFVREKSGKYCCVRLKKGKFTLTINMQSGVRPHIKAHKSEVVVLTSENFDSIVKDASKNVLVEFYAPWCGHCKNLGKS